MRLLAFKARKAARGSSPTKSGAPHLPDSDIPVGADSGVGLYVADVTPSTHLNNTSNVEKRRKKTKSYVAIEDAIDEEVLQIDGNVSIHASERCYECGKYYATYDMLITHIEREHNTTLKPNEFVPCVFCYKKFYTYLSLRDHKISNHKEGLKTLVF